MITVAGLQICSLLQLRHYRKTVFQWREWAAIRAGVQYSKTSIRYSDHGGSILAVCVLILVPTITSWLISLHIGDPRLRSTIPSRRLEARLFDVRLPRSPKSTEAQSPAHKGQSWLRRVRLESDVLYRSAGFEDDDGGGQITLLYVRSARDLCFRTAVKNPFDPGASSIATEFRASAAGTADGQMPVPVLGTTNRARYCDVSVLSNFLWLAVISSAVGVLGVLFSERLESSSGMIAVMSAGGTTALIRPHRDVQTHSPTS